MSFWVTSGQNLKKLLLYLKSVPSSLANVKFHVKQIDFKWPYFGTFRSEFLKKLLLLEINSFGFVELQSFAQNKKVEFGTENVLLGYFKAMILK